MTFSQFIKQLAEHVLAREFAMPLSGLALAIRNDPSCKYLQLKPITLHKILQSYPDSFKFQGAREDPEVSLRLSIDICNNVRNCPGFPQCKDLHICRYFMMDNCIHTKRKTRAPCPYPHSLDSKHNRKVRQYHNLLSLDINALKKRMQDSADFASQEAPVDLKLCFYYTRRVCERDDCPYLHLCEFFVKGSCKFGRRCKKNHDVCARDIEAILREHNIDADGDEEDILENIRARLYGDGEEESEEEVTSEEEESFEQPKKPNPNQQNAVPTTSRRSYTNFRKRDRH
uniref:C3H1-type domain-containing protein n=1 Tax=Magallana gigas TaxID=29159 RepID=A0A8W8NNB7_MAGGI